MSFNEHYGRLIYFGLGAEYSKKLYKPLMEEDYSKNSFPESTSCPSICVEEK